MNIDQTYLNLIQPEIQKSITPEKIDEFKKDNSSHGIYGHFTDEQIINKLSLDCYLQPRTLEIEGYPCQLKVYGTRHPDGTDGIRCHCTLPHSDKSVDGVWIITYDDVNDALKQIVEKFDQELWDNWDEDRRRLRRKRKIKKMEEEKKFGKKTILRGYDLRLFL